MSSSPGSITSDVGLSFEVRQTTSPTVNVGDGFKYSTARWPAQRNTSSIISGATSFLTSKQVRPDDENISPVVPRAWRMISPIHKPGFKTAPALPVDLYSTIDLSDPALQEATHVGVFTSEIELTEDPNRYASRYHKITGITAEDFEQEQFSKGFYGSMKGEMQYSPIVGVQKITHFGVTYVRFNSVTDSAEAWRLCDESSHRHGLSFKARFVTAEEYHQSQLVDAGHRASRAAGPSSLQRPGQIHEGEILIKVNCIPVAHDYKPLDVDFLVDLRNQLISYLDYFDRVIAFEYASINAGKLYIRIETDSILAGDKIVKFVQGRHVTIARSLSPTDSVLVEFSATHWDPSQNPDNWLSREVVAIARHDNNRVIYDRVASGHDCRTSVMLRDLPNRMSFFEVRRLLDNISPGRYDFSYLRIDFENQHNVGYVFINFLSAEDILPFMRRVVGHRWQIYSSEKIAQLSYANIQGREALAERFKNSAVITAWSCFRPKQWESELDEGYNPHCTPAEQPFPGVTNQAKFERSISNQTIVGLYAPGHKGPHFPQQQQHRRRLVRNNGLADLNDITALDAFPKPIHYSAPSFRESSYTRHDTRSSSLPSLFEGLSLSTV